MVIDWVASMRISSAEWQNQSTGPEVTGKKNRDTDLLSQSSRSRRPISLCKTGATDSMSTYAGNR
jgi:hypothetical protein